MSVSKDTLVKVVRIVLKKSKQVCLSRGPPGWTTGTGWGSHLDVSKGTCSAAKSVKW